VAEQANFIFVADSCAGTAQEAEYRLEKASGGEFAVISGEARRAANGWLVPIRLLSDYLREDRMTQHSVANKTTSRHMSP
jgi:hypothetical protein